MKILVEETIFAQQMWCIGEHKTFNFIYTLSKQLNWEIDIKDLIYYSYLIGNLTAENVMFCSKDTGGKHDFCLFIYFFFLIFGIGSKMPKSDILNP